MSKISDRIEALLACVCDALTEADRAPCKCYMTVGPPVVGICCECGAEGVSGELTGHLESIYDADAETLTRVLGRMTACRAGTQAMDVAIVLTRCYPRIDEQGNMPESDDLNDAADSLHEDIQIVRKALRCCGERISFRETAVDSMPTAGCSMFAVRITVEV